MKLTEQSNWLLSSLELALCLRMFGPEPREAIPVAVSQQPLPRRMLDAFLHLTEIGLLAYSDGAYRPTELLRKRLLPVAEPERILLLSDAEGATTVYFRAGERVILERVGADGQTCRIRSADDDALTEALLERIGEALPARPAVELREADGTLRDWIRFSADGADGTERLCPEAVRGFLQRAAPAPGGTAAPRLPGGGISADSGENGRER